MPRFVSFLLIIGVTWGMATSAQAQSMAPYYTHYDFLAGPPAAYGQGLGGYAHPALPAAEGNSLQVLWATDGRNHGDVQNWGAFTSLGGLSGSLSRIRNGGLQATGYHVGLAGGDRRFALGMAFQGFAGDARALGRVNRLTAGFISRPSRYLSVGLTYNIGLQTSDREVVAELGVRPLGSSRFTMFAHAAVFEGDALQNAPWSVGASAEVVRGLDVVGRYFENDAFSLGLRLNLGRSGASSQARFDADAEYASSTYGLRLGEYVPNAFSEAVQRERNHVALELRGPVRYQQTQIEAWTQDGVGRLYEVLSTIERAAASDRVRTVALNLSGLQIQPALAWELRTALQDAQAAGTEVLVYIDYAGMNTYHVASVADHVIMDPEGTLMLDGYASSQTFLAGTLDKLGIAVDDWRLFSHKSALEALDRTDFSDAEREQRSAYVDAFYETVRTDVGTARSLDAEAFDAVVNTQTILFADKAIEAGLVDATGRWSNLPDLLEEQTGAGTSALDVSDLNETHTATRAWSAPPSIALIYGIGGTSMDAGMNARRLEQTIRQTARRGNVEAIVFRVDSPGGDPLAADLVAEALRDAAQDMPVIISQGQVAASGGYWVSMYGDDVWAAPTTLTGSIGVVAGWIYDDGFSEHAGFDYDVVQRGDRADAMRGYQIPLLGAELPARDLRDDERERVEEQITHLYTRFVEKVAEGRSLNTNMVREIAEGRVWTGTAAQERDLVDNIGGLAAALDAARDAANLNPEWMTVREVNAISGFFRFEQLVPAPIAALLETNEAPYTDEPPMEAFIRLMVEHQPHPLVLLPPGIAPEPAQ